MLRLPDTCCGAAQDRLPAIREGLRRVQGYHDPIFTRCRAFLCAQPLPSGGRACHVGQFYQLPRRQQTDQTNMTGRR